MRVTASFVLLTLAVATNALYIPEPRDRITWTFPIVDPRTSSTLSRSTLTPNKPTPIAPKPVPTSTRSSKPTSGAPKPTPVVPKPSSTSRATRPTTVTTVRAGSGGVDATLGPPKATVIFEPAPGGPAATVGPGGSGSVGGGSIDVDNGSVLTFGRRQAEVTLGPPQATVIFEPVDGPAQTIGPGGSQTIGTGGGGIAVDNGVGGATLGSGGAQPNVPASGAATGSAVDAAETPIDIPGGAITQGPVQGGITFGNDDTTPLPTKVPVAPGSGGVVPPVIVAPGSGGVVPPVIVAPGSGGAVPPVIVAPGSGGVALPPVVAPGSGGVALPPADPAGGLFPSGSQIVTLPIGTVTFGGGVAVVNGPGGATTFGLPSATGGAGNPAVTDGPISASILGGEVSQGPISSSITFDPSRK